MCFFLLRQLCPGGVMRWLCLLKKHLALSFVGVREKECWFLATVEQPNAEYARSIHLTTATRVHQRRWLIGANCKNYNCFNFVRDNYRSIIAGFWPGLILIKMLMFGTVNYIQHYQTTDLSLSWCLFCVCQITLIIVGQVPFIYILTCYYAFCIRTSSALFLSKILIKILLHLF